MTMKMTSRKMRQRRVLSAWTPNGDSGWTAGNNCIEITIYEERGQCFAVPYLRVILSGGSEVRANAANYDVVFAPPDGR